MHADTLKAIQKKTSKKQASTDSTKQELYAYHKVKFTKKDMQGKCDSMYYNAIDSVMKMRGKPILWNNVNQLTADCINITTGKKSLKTMELFGTAFVISETDSLHYNQVKGKYMKGFFNDNKLVRVNVEGNGQTIYYVNEKDKKTNKEEIKAVNRAECSDLTIYLKENEIDRITFKTKPDATVFPIDQIELKEFKLKGFNWRKKEQPLKKEDIFIW